jgi:hypothetical protein
MIKLTSLPFTTILTNMAFIFSPLECGKNYQEVVMKKIIILLFVVSALAFLFPFSTSYANDTAATSKPSVTYGSSSEFGKYEYFGPWPTNKWGRYGGVYIYHSRDKDAYEAINYKSNVSLSSTSSTKFSFKSVAEVLSRDLLDSDYVLDRENRPE